MSNVKKSRSRRSAPMGRFVTKKEMNGGAYRPPTNPPQVTFMPWHSVTLVISHTSDLSVKVNDLMSYLKSQLDPTGRGFNATTTGDKRFVVQLKLRSISSWNLTGRVISLSVEDFSDTTTASGGRDQLCGLVDTGTSTHTPAVGYRIPSSLTHHVLRTDDVSGPSYLFTVTAPSGSQCVTYVSLMYRFDGPAKHPEILSPIAEVEQSLNKVVDRLNQEKPRSTIDIILNGIKYTAEAVAVVGAIGVDSSNFNTPDHDKMVACTGQRRQSHDTSSHLSKSFDQIDIDEVVITTDTDANPHPVADSNFH